MSDELEKQLARAELELEVQDKKIEELEKIALQVVELQEANVKLAEVIEKLRERLQRMEIVIYSKLTRRQQKQFPKWVEAVDMSTELKLKETFAFPKIGLQAMDGGKWVRLTGTAQSEGLTKEEGADICEYLNSFPENQHQLKNMDAEFRDEKEEFALRAKLAAEGRK